MTPVHQSKLYSQDAIHNGNCYAACLASLLDLPLWMVPPFEDMFGRSDWHRRSQEWLERMFGMELVRTEGHAPGSLPDYYIASGLSSRGVRHSVIYGDGQLIHDPHPSREGIVAVEWCWHLEKAKANK
jgi:hypothetical protein